MRLARHRARGVAAVALGTLTALGATGLAIGADAATTATTAAASSLILSPHRGATINTNSVRIVVRAGNEYDDVNARLNGKQIGPDFTRPGGGVRVLNATDSDGLRYGDNELRVTATEGLATHTSTVRFRVVTPKLLVGAGVTQFVPVGSAARLDGRIRVRMPGSAPSQTKWAVVSAPAGSRFARTRSARAEAARTASGPAVKRVDDPLKFHGRPDDPLARFTPDALGPYLVRLTSEVGGDRVSNQVTVDAVPRSPVVTIDTGASMNGTPGIRVGDKVLPAPPLAKDASGKGLYSGTEPGKSYKAVLQIVALDRATLAVIWNRTYGLCTPTGTNDTSFCRLEDGQTTPKVVNITADLASLGDGAMVVISSHPAESAMTGSGFWEAPTSILAVLEHIGAPTTDDHLLDGATAGGLSAIGVPGSPAGSANVNVVPGGNGAMRGYLGADPNHHFAFMPAARVEFDSRPSEACANGFCTITQTVGDQTAKATLRTDEEGYLVSAYNPHTLKLADSQLFVMVGPGASDRNQVVAMNNFLTKVAATGDVILVTMYRTPSGGRPLPGQGIPQTPGEWVSLANEIAAVGGTQNTFNLSAASEQGLYSLVGWGGAGAGNGSETTTGIGRLEGALVPNNLSLFRPSDVAAGGEPAEQLTQIIVRKPVTSWPLDHDPAAHRALQWLGSKVPALGSSPRTAYWYTDIDAAKAALINDQLSHLDYPSGEDFNEGDFSTARKELIKEVRWVGNVRDYLALLASPQNQAGGSAWEDATKLNNDLTNQLGQLKEKAEVQFSWVNVASSILDIVGGFSDLKKEGEDFAKFVDVLASSTLLTGEVFDRTWNGAPANDAERTVQADELSTEIEQESKRTVDAYDRMGDMIVSDPTKLEEVGKWAGCNPADGGCDGGRYAEFALPKAAAQAGGAAAIRGIDRVLYERLVPLAFGVWNTGTAHDPDPSRFSCLASADDPFRAETPPQAYASVLVGLDPDHAGDKSAQTNNEWDTYMTVARSGQTYGWPSKALLERMYGPVSTSDDASEGGLGISAASFLPTAKPHYVPGGLVDCSWDNSRDAP